MVATVNYLINPSDVTAPGLRVVFGRNTLTPDAIGGFTNIALPSLNYTVESFFAAFYDFNSPFVLANAGTLGCLYVAASQVLQIISSNVADNNTIRWIAVTAR